jgi:hypothetical protein
VLLTIFRNHHMPIYITLKTSLSPKRVVELEIIGLQVRI